MPDTRQFSFTNRTHNRKMKALYNRITLVGLFAVMFWINYQEASVKIAQGSRLHIFEWCRWRNRGPDIIRTDLTITHQTHDTLLQGLKVSEGNDKAENYEALDFGSLGNPRPRSAIIFFCIWDVPPPMIKPRLYI